MAQYNEHDTIINIIIIISPPKITYSLPSPYRKYRPLKKPAKCTGCHQSTVRFAYHALCGECIGKRSCCAKCGRDRASAEAAERELEALNTQIDMLTHTKGALPGFTERERRSTLRELLRERAKVLEVDAEDAEGEAVEADAAAVAAQASEPVKRKIKAAVPVEGGDADVAESAGASASARVLKSIATEEEEEEEEEDEEEEEEDEDSGEDLDNNDDTEDVPKQGGGYTTTAAAAGGSSRGEGSTAAVSKAAKATAATKPRAAAATRQAWGTGDADEEGLVDPAIFTKALEEAQRRKRAMGME